MGATAETLLADFPAVRRRTLTVAEYHRMAEAGILGPEERLELIGGEIVATAPIGGAHAWAVAALTRAFLEVRDEAVVWVQNPIRIDDRTEPEPDVTLLRGEARGARATLPGAGDVLLLVEVADTSLDYDRRVKRRLYAHHGIPEFWIVNLAAGEIEVHRGPTPSGYASVEVVGRDGVLSPLAFPALRVGAAEVLG